jgi:hypothetical protein
VRRWLTILNWYPWHDRADWEQSREGNWWPWRTSQLIPLRHRLGFHGANWHPFWLRGNVWTECIVCGARRMPSFGDASEIPPEEIAPRSRFCE